MRSAWLLVAVTACGRIGFGGAREDHPPDDLDAAPAEAGSPSDAAASACRSNPLYVHAGGSAHAYKVVQGDDGWLAAKASCAADGAYLAILDDAAEAAILPGNGWVGYSDAATEGTWLTVLGGPALFLPWQAGEPGGGVAKNCARFEDSTRQLESRVCADTREWICECD
jgi:hypothetical protein